MDSASSPSIRGRRAGKTGAPTPHGRCRSCRGTGMWSSGDTVVLRNVWHGRVRQATPTRVIEDGARIVLWHPVGTREWVPSTGGVPREWHLVERTTPHDVVVVHERGWHFCVHVVHTNGSLLCWYVNF